MNNFSMIYVVIRTYKGDNSVVLGVFKTFEGADNFAGACQQQMMDLDPELEKDFRFFTQVTTYYNE
jgi:hypothetical protein